MNDGARLASRTLFGVVLVMSLAACGNKGDLSVENSGTVDVIVFTGDQEISVPASGAVSVLGYGCTPGDVTVRFASGQEVFLRGPVCPGSENHGWRRHRHTDEGLIRRPSHGFHHSSVPCIARYLIRSRYGQLRGRRTHPVAQGRAGVLRARVLAAATGVRPGAGLAIDRSATPHERGHPLPAALAVCASRASWKAPGRSRQLAPRAATTNSPTTAPPPWPRLPRPGDRSVTTSPPSWRTPHEHDAKHRSLSPLGCGVPQRPRAGAVVSRPAGTHRHRCSRA